MAKRFTESVQLQPQNLDTGAAQGMMNLASRLDQFAAAGRREGARAGARIGAQEGAQQELETTIVDGHEVTAAPKRREASLLDIIASGGERTSAFNRTVGTAYIASIANDNREALAGIETATPDDIASFNNKADGYIKGVMENVDPVLRGAVKQNLDDLLTSGRIRVQGRAETKVLNQANASLQKTSLESSRAAGNAARSGDNLQAQEALANAFVAIDARVAAGDMTSAQALAFKEKHRLEVKEQTLKHGFDQLFENNKPVEEQFHDAYEHLKSIAGEAPKGWTNDEWDRFIDGQQADLGSRANREKKLQAEQSQEIALQVSNLKIKASTGMGEPSAVMQEANDLFASGDITGKERASIISKVINGLKQGAEKQEKETAHLSNVAARLAGDKSQVVSQKDIDFAWDEKYSKGLSDDPVLKSAQITEFIDDTKAIPTAVKQQVINDINSEDPDLIVNAADFIDRIDVVRGLPENSFSANERAMSKAMSGLIKNMVPKEALALARRATDPNDRARIDLRTEQIKEMKKPPWNKRPLNYITVVQDLFDDAAEHDEAALANEYGALFEQHYIAGMTREEAETTAAKILERNWGDFNGQFMKYPPSDSYMVAGNSDYIVDQLYSDVLEFGMGGLEFEKDDIVLMSNQQTARTKSAGQPIYGVSVFVEGEGLIPLVGFKWMPDTQAEIARLEKKHETSVRTKRESQKKREADIMNPDRFRGL